MLADFHFLRPDWFWALPGIAVLALLLARRQLAVADIGQLHLLDQGLDARLVQQLEQRLAGGASRFRIESAEIMTVRRNIFFIT